MRGAGAFCLEARIEVMRLKMHRRDSRSTSRCMDLAPDSQVVPAKLEKRPYEARRRGESQAPERAWHRLMSPPCRTSRTCIHGLRQTPFPHASDDRAQSRPRPLPSIRIPYRTAGIVLRLTIHYLRETNDEAFSLLLRPFTFESRVASPAIISVMSPLAPLVK